MHSLYVDIKNTLLKPKYLLFFSKNTFFKTLVLLYVNLISLTHKVYTSRKAVDIINITFIFHYKRLL